MYVVLAAAGAIAPTPSIGVRDLIGRYRHGIDAPDQLGGLGFLIGSEESVLRSLRSLELQALILSGQGCNLVLSQKVKDGPAVGVLVVDDVPRTVLNGVPGIASLGRHVVANALNCRLGSRTLGRQVIIHAVDGPGVVTAALLELSAQVTHSGVNPVEAVVDSVGQRVGAVTDTLLNAIDAALEVVQGETLIDVCTGSPALESGAVGSDIAATEAAIAAPAEHTEDQK